MIDSAGSGMALSNPLIDKVGYHVRRCSALFMGDLRRALSEFGMKPAEATTLLAIARNPGCTQSDVCEVLDVKRANMVPTIALLLSGGLIVRQQLKGRAMALNVTRKGARLADQLDQRIAEHDRRFQSKLTHEEIAEVIRILEKIRANEAID